MYKAYRYKAGSQYVRERTLSTSQTYLEYARHVLRVRSRRIFNYVALSRCRTFNGIHLLSPITRELIMVDESVRRFFKTMSK